MQHRFQFAMFTAAALSAALVSPAFARGDENWANLDRELEALASSAAQANPDGPKLSGLVRARYAYLPEILPGAEDYSGFEIDRAQVVLEGQASESYSYRIQYEGAGSTAQLLDAFGAWQANEYLRVTMGRFRAPLAWESQLDDSDLLFLTRTDLGELFYQRDDGAMLSAKFDIVNVSVSMQNGLDSAGEEQAFCARAGVDVLGGGVGLHQGAYGAGEQTRLSAGAGYYNDQSIGNGNDGTITTADAQLQLSRFYAEAMVTKFGDGFNGVFTNRSDSTPYTLSASWMLVENRWEVALRYQDTDNVFQESDTSLGVNYYVAGHDVKWQAVVAEIQSDDPNIDQTWRFGVGLNVNL